MSEDEWSSGDEPETPVYTCDRCGQELTYAGRGRPPKNCTEKNGGDPSCYGRNKRQPADRTPRVTPASKVVEQAADVLVSLNSAVGMGAFFLGFKMSASQLAGEQDAFRTRAVEALKLDPDLCKMILRGGQNSGKVALIMAYGMMFMNVAPIAVSEYRMLRESRENVTE